MQFTIFAIAAAVAGLAAAAPAPAATETKIFQAFFTPYTNGDDSCQQKDANGVVAYDNSTNVGKCLEMPGNTASVLYRVPSYAEAVDGCAVTYYDDLACTKAQVGYALTNGALGCQSGANFPGNSIGAIKVTC